MAASVCSVVRSACAVKVIPVIDLLNGVVVRGVAGNRSAYRPVKSRLAVSADPSVVLAAFEDQLPVTSCYLADLDALEGRSANRCVLAELTRSPLELIVDAGVTNSDDVQELLDLGVGQVVVASETLPGPNVAADLVRHFGRERLIFSLDLKNQRPLVATADWGHCGPMEIAEQIYLAGYRRMIVLDLASVGTHAGPATSRLCQQISDRLPGLKLISGGGIRSRDDLQTYKVCGCEAVLIASALHDGQLAPTDLIGL